MEYENYDSAEEFLEEERQEEERNFKEENEKEWDEESDYNRFSASTMYAKPISQKQIEMIKYLWSEQGIDGNLEEIKKMNGFAASQFIKKLIKEK